MQFSIIIPAHNEEQNLRRCLAGVSQLRGEYEVIVVCNGCDDSTAAVAEEFGAKAILCNRLSPGNARNRGVQESKAEILAFLDADCVPAADWLEAGQRSLLGEPCITGAEYGPQPGAGWVERSWCTQRPGGRYRANHVAGGNLFIRREDFLRCGGFRGDLETGEDFDLCARAWSTLELPTISDSRISVTHLGNPKTLSGLYFRELWHGQSARKTLSNPLHNRPLIAGVIFTIALITAPIALFLFPAFASVNLLLLFVVPCLAVLHRLREGANIQRPAHLAILYSVYFFARGLALVVPARGRTSAAQAIDLRTRYRTSFF